MFLPDGIHQQKLLVRCLIDGTQKAVYPTIEVVDGQVIPICAQTCDDASGASLCKKCTSRALESFINSFA